MPAEELNASDLLLPRLILALDSAAIRGLSIAALRALLFIAAVSSRKENPNLATISDLAKCLEMSISGASRVVASLRTQERALIMSDKEEHGQRQESFFLSEHGICFMRRLARLWQGESEVDMDYFSFARFAKAKYVDNISSNEIRILEYRPDDMIMYIEPVQEDIYNEIFAFYGVESIEFVDYENSSKAIVIRFLRKENAVAFMLRCCHPSALQMRKKPSYLPEAHV